MGSWHWGCGVGDRPWGPAMGLVLGGGEGSSLGGSTAGIGVGEAQQWGLALGVGICGV